MDFKTLNRLTGRKPYERHVAERRNHQFSDDIGGCSANYREPKFGGMPNLERLNRYRVEQGLYPIREWRDEDRIIKPWEDMK